MTRGLPRLVPFQYQRTDSTLPVSTYYILYINYTISLVDSPHRVLVDSPHRVIPYSGKLSRKKSFTNFADLMPFVKVFSTKMVVAHFGLLPIIYGRW